MKQNAHLTFKENLGAGRHGWLRLTPAYSYKLVGLTLDPLSPEIRVLDPFSGSGTTGLAAAERGLSAHLVDVNPFLVWLARLKTDRYSVEELAAVLNAGTSVIDRAAAAYGRTDNLWRPAIHEIERWWARPVLDGLSALRNEIDRLTLPPRGIGLLEIALCRTLISLSNAAFNHQSMSFRGSRGGDDQLALDLPETLDARYNGVLERFVKEVQFIAQTASVTLPGRASVTLGDARSLGHVRDQSFDLLYSSPPYVNRMSYIRELRPYMYWLRYLGAAREAGELDWTAIGGTWGIATSRVAEWQPPNADPLPLGRPFASVLRKIRGGGPNGPLLARYVHKYFDDMWQHFQAAHRVVSPGGSAIYIIGNSSFYGTLVPAEAWYAILLREAGFATANIETLRKRNSKKELFEFSVVARN